jgi:L-rhamnose isomerase
MKTELEDCNPKFIKWAKEHGIGLDFHADWYPWLECWVDGYTKGVSDVKGIMQGTKELENILEGG